MSTTVRSSSSNAAAVGGGTAISVSAPAGTTAGDKVLLIISTNGVITHTDNNGSTPFTIDSTLGHYSPTASATLTFWTRTIVGGDPSTYNFTLSVDNRWSIIAVTFQNPHATLFDVSSTGGNFSAAAVTSITSVSITTLTANAIHCAMCQTDGDFNILDTPAGYTFQQQAGAPGAGQTLVLVNKLIATASATGAQTFGNFDNNTTSGLSASCIAASLAVKDEAAGGAAFNINISPFTMIEET